jgi:phosphoglycerate dehydrogenase-like enzyme
MKILIIPNTEKSMENMMAIKESHKGRIKDRFPSDEIIVDARQDKWKPEIIIASRLDGIEFEPPLKWIHLTSAGVEELPQRLIKSDILITNSSGVHSIPIAEHVLGFMLVFCRRLYKSFRIQLQEKRWVRDFKIQDVSELYGKTVAIIGLGRIGSRIAQLAKAFGMRTVGVVRTQGVRTPVDKLFTSIETDKALKSADYVVVCLPLTKETYHSFDFKRFRQMKPSAFFINIGRGKVVNELDLVKALKRNLIAGAGLDVTEEEPLAETSELWSMDNVIITPHYSGWTPYYMDRVIDIFCQNLRAFHEGKRMPTLVDKELGY